MKTVRTFFVILCLAAVVSCTSPRKKGLNAGHDARFDSLYSVERAMSIYGTEPERALAILDSAEIVGNATGLEADMARLNVYARTLDQLPGGFNKAMQTGAELLERREVEEDLEKQQAVYAALVAAARRKGDENQQIRWAVALADVSRALGQEAEALRAEVEIGLVTAELGRYEEGMSRINKAISALQPPRNFQNLDVYVIALRRKIYLLEINGKWAEAIPEAKRILSIIEEFEKNPAAFHDGSQHEPASDSARASYVAFNRCKAWAYLATEHANLDQVPDAMYYLTLYERSGALETLSGRSTISPVWRKLEQWDKMLAVYDQLEMAMGADTLNTDFTNILEGRAIAAAATGQNAKAHEYWKRYAATARQVAEIELSGLANDYSVRYGEAEKQLELERARSDVRKGKAAVAIFAALMLSAVALAVVLWQKRRDILVKNHALSQEIDEALSYKKKYERLLHKYGDSETPPSRKAKQLKEMSNSELFAYLSADIHANRLFLDPSFDRQQIVDRYKLSESRVGSAFAQGSEYRSISDFVRECRLDHACELLKTTDMTVSDIAFSSGFSRVTTFNHDFKNKYGLTPTEYRQS